MGSFFLRFGFYFGFGRRIHVYAGSCAKAGRPPQTRHDCAVFFDCLRLCCENPSIVIQFATARPIMTTPPSTRQAVTQLLGEWSNGDDGALGKLLPMVHPELHRLAHHYMSRERTGHTLQTTAVLNEAYLQLVDSTKPVLQGRTHFIAAAAQIMRHIMVDHARKHQSLKRGGSALKVILDEAALVTETRAQELLDLDEALERLAAQDARKSQIVELRYFGGLTVEETAEFLKLSQRTVEREWTAAKAWLYRELSEEET